MTAVSHKLSKLTLLILTWHKLLLSCNSRHFFFYTICFTEVTNNCDLRLHYFNITLDINWGPYVKGHILSSVYSWQCWSLWVQLMWIRPQSNFLKSLLLSPAPTTTTCVSSQVLNTYSAEGFQKAFTTVVKQMLKYKSRSTGYCWVLIFLDLSSRLVCKALAVVSTCNNDVTLACYLRSRSAATDPWAGPCWLSLSPGSRLKVTRVLQSGPLGSATPCLRIWGLQNKWFF